MHIDPCQRWVWGAAVYLVGTLATSCATHLVQLGHRLKSTQRSSDDLDPCTADWNLIGWMVFALGNSLNFYAFGLASQALLSTLAACQFVSNVVFARLFLGERITKSTISATFAIVFGIIIIFSTSDQRSPNLFVTSQFMAMYMQRHYLVYIGIVSITTIVCHCMYMKFRSRSDNRLCSLLFAIVSAMPGSQLVQLSKSLSMLLQSRHIDNPFTHPFVYIIIVILVVLVVFWLRRLDAALRKFPAIVIIPFMQTLWMLNAILGGGIYFGEFNRFTLRSTVGFVIGVLFVLVGINVILYGRSTNQDGLCKVDLESSIISSSRSSTTNVEKIVP